MSTSKLKRIVLVLLAGLIVTALGASAQTRARGAIAGLDLSESLEATARGVAPAVVEIFTTSYAPGEGLVPSTADLVRTERASGSGVIVDPDGFIVTNAHVVRGAQRLRVEVFRPGADRSILAEDRRTVDGRLVGIDLETDLAVIKIDGRNLAALRFGDSDKLNAGQIVLAFGSPLGFHNSVSLGIVSAVARQLEPESPMVYVQTDASINPGSSGGPLVDRHGELVGINTLIVSQSGGHEGLGFAAPSNIVKTVYEQLRKTGHVRRGDIGVRAQTVTGALAAGLGLSRDRGALLADVVPGSSADRAGLRPGDVVVAIDGKPMENGRQLHVTLYRRFIGDVVTLDVLRDRVALRVPVAMTERLNPDGELSAAIDPRQNLVPRLGILGVDLDERLARMLPVSRVPSAVVVVSTVAGALDVRDGGLATGDVIYSMNRTPVVGVADLRARLDRLKTGDAVVLQLERRGELMYLAFTVD